jgi:23S rRNA (cytidine1920-2'-O)/16S rRNA (cytidine1409-2'-O)-methyltransferase
VAEAATAAGLGVAGVCPSPLPGPAGNLELVVWLRVDGGPLDDAALRAAVAEGEALPGAASRRGQGNPEDRRDGPR